jgi:hypothetical protein
LLNSLILKKKNFNKKNFVINCILIAFNKIIISEIFINIGNSGYVFINSFFAHKHSLLLFFLNIFRIFTIFDGRETALNLIIYVAYFDFRIIKYIFYQISLFVTRLAQHFIIIKLPWLRYYKTDIRLNNNIIVFNLPFYHRHCMFIITVIKYYFQIFWSGKILNIATIGTIFIIILFRKKNHILFTVTIKNINKTFAVEKPLDLIKFPEKYREFADLCSRELSNKLLSRRPYDYKIPLISDAVLPFGSLYGMF